RDTWPNPAAVRAAAGADQVLDAARLTDDTAGAIADLDFVLAPTARLRDLAMRVLNPRTALRELVSAAAGGRRVGVMFGPERTGLTNDDLVLANAIVSVPLNPGFASLNIAQAVLIIAYEWSMHRSDMAD